MDPNIPGHYCVSLPEASGLMQPPIRGTCQVQIECSQDMAPRKKKAQGLWEEPFSKGYRKYKSSDFNSYNSYNSYVIYYIYSECVCIYIYICWRLASGSFSWTFPDLQHISWQALEVLIPRSSDSVFRISDRIMAPIGFKDITSLILNTMGSTKTEIMPSFACYLKKKWLKRWTQQLLWLTSVEMGVSENGAYPQTANWETDDKPLELGIPYFSGFAQGVFFPSRKSTIWVILKECVLSFGSPESANSSFQTTP